MFRVISKNKPKEEVFKALVMEFYSKYPDADVATITIKKDKPSRSDSQNRLYFKWVDIIGKELGYSKDETHLLLADKFLGKIEFTTKKGKVISQIKSTRELKIGEFTDYLNEIEMFVGEYGITLPDGDDYQLAMGK